MTREYRTPEADAALLIAYSAGGIKAACAHVPHLTVSGVWRRLRAAGITPKRRLAMRDWDQRELDLLERMRGEGVRTRDIAVRLGRSKYSVDGQIAIQIKARRFTPKLQLKRWTAGNRKFVDRSVDQLVDHIARTLGRTPSSVRHEITRALREANKRQSTARIADLGGMTVAGRRAAA